MWFDSAHFTRFAWQHRLGCLLTAVAMAVFTVGAHTLPISYLRLVPETEYLHLELAFNPFELTFMSELDENRDGELSPGELQTHGQTVADRVTAALKISAGGRRLQTETAGMDPDLNGHHVRLRAHYKVDARHLALTVESDLISVMSHSHLAQVTYSHPDGPQMAQLDSLSRQVTFTPAVLASRIDKDLPPPMVQRMPIAFLVVAVMALLACCTGAVILMRKRKRTANEESRYRQQPTETKI